MGMPHFFLIIQTLHSFFPWGGTLRFQHFNKFFLIFDILPSLILH